ncbi:hypothetical protein N7539_001524 [Penicillium diatomitis]|uniref:Inner kinetochore subunit AME1 domain-containing protein n=1 Tax=Penicillium diatomitis TaxID=2819901 RepID=A0A9W9XH54_9EURO|nr:uncharacterized protein N7539_001524 [Penicillium diatomitis]KAJ5492778.1 hypothetical protein N7539_001524 [Penicillium diatomitis]
MASTREERLQMRQRGAGTHKTKAIDFGFSFGGGAIDASAPVIRPQSLVPDQSAQVEVAPTVATSPSLHANANIQRTPESARTSLPARPSPYDIPIEDEPDQPRSNKRRKLNPSPRNSITPLRASTAIVEKETLTTTETSVSLAGTFSNGQTSLSTTPRATQVITSGPLQTEHEQSQLGEPNKESNDQVLPSESPQNEPTSPGITHPSPPKVPQQEQRPQTRSKSQSPQQKTGPSAEKTVRAANTRTRKSTSPAVVTTPEGTDIAPTESTPGGQILPSPQQGNHNKDRSLRVSTRRRSSDAQDEDIQATIDAGTRAVPGREADPAGINKSRKSRSNKKSPNPRPLEELNPEETSAVNNISLAEIAQPPSRTHKKRGRGMVSPGASKGQPAAPQGRSQSPVETQVPVATSASARTRRGRKKKSAGAASGGQAEDTANRTREVPETDADGDTEIKAGPPERQPVLSARAKGKRAAKASTTNPEEQPDSEVTEEPKRKPRAPRGDTVPVTVHRLVNVGALNALDADAEGSPEDGLSSAKAKLPTRGGVNAADVLGQICRETLEKTLEKLKAGIENETNAHKRAEWSRKRKAVEEFGSELDSRLMDISEVLESNFVLGMQLKKTKRDVMDLRNYLYQVRKERESIAIQMDAVRAKHMDEEKAQSARNTINNSLHSLEMALDRSQTRAESGSGMSPSDLEFMLRTVADNRPQHVAWSGPDRNTFAQEGDTDKSVDVTGVCHLF